MIRDPSEIRVEHREGGGGPDTSLHDAPSLGELFKRLTTDMGELIRQEAALVKTEVRRASATVARDAMKVGIAAGLAFSGIIALTIFLILAIGNLFDGNYWLSALLVGVAMLAIGAVMVKSAVNDIKGGALTPDQTIATLREDRAWASQQARELKHELTTDPTTTGATARPTRR